MRPDLRALEGCGRKALFIFCVSGFQSGLGTFKRVLRAGDVNIFLPLKGRSHHAYPVARDGQHPAHTGGTAGLAVRRDAGFAISQRRHIIDVPRKDADVAVNGAHQDALCITVKAQPVRRHDLQMKRSQALSHPLCVSDGRLSLLFGLFHNVVDGAGK